MPLQISSGKRLISLRSTWPLIGTGSTTGVLPARRNDEYRAAPATMALATITGKAPMVMPYTIQRHAANA
jgi:hypothetical protein